LGLCQSTDFLKQHDVSVAGSVSTFRRRSS